MLSPRDMLFFLAVTVLIGSTQAGNSLAMQGKTWWLRYITDDLYTAARLSTKQIKYASDVGFKSLVSLPTILQDSTFGAEYLPTTEEEREIANLANLEYDIVLNPGETWQSVAAVEKFTAIYEGLPKPVLLHCYSSFSASFIALAHLMVTTDFDINDVTRRMALLGFDISALVPILEELNPGEPPLTGDPPTVDFGPSGWLSRYWVMRPISKNIFLAGQLEAHHLDLIYSAGIRTVINNRKGVTTSDEPSQEEVSLLNIRDGTGTYTGAGRQSVEELEKNRINANLPNEYISETSDVNYEMRNSDQFGDDVGYNETLQSMQFEEHPLNYVHMPIGGELGYTTEMFMTYKADLIRYLIDGPILIHCRSTSRSGVLAWLLAADIDGRDSQWVFETAAEYGMFYDEDSTVGQLFISVLDAVGAAHTVTVAYITLVASVISASLLITAW